MNTLKYFLCAAILIVTGCAKDGEPGPQGPKGEPGVGTEGPAGKDGNTTSFYFQQGFKGYEGTRDVGICNDPLSDVFVPLYPPPTPEGKFMYAGVEDVTSDTMTALLRFEGLAEIIEETHGESVCSGNFFINEATLYLSGVFQNDDNGSLQFGIYKENAPVFDEMSATWEKANADESWSKPGGEEPWAFHDPLYSTAYPEDNIGYLAPLQITSGNKTMVHKPFYIPRDAVKRWLCEGANKGLRVAPHFNPQGFVLIYSSEHSEQQLRPLLYINIEKVDANTRRQVLSEEEARAAWEKKTYGEKMTPLYRLYPALQPESSGGNKRNGS